MENEDLLLEMKEWRRYLHKYPEIAFKEVETSKFIADKLIEMGYQVETQIGETGVVGILKCGDGKDVIGLRADIDAIEMKEEGDVDHISRHDGRMHACGHDGHIATLLGAARLISSRKNFNGTVCLVFQPAEEPGKGAQAMIDDGLIENFGIDEMYGLHNIPFLPEGTLSTRVGGIMASEDNFNIKIEGRGGHASSPHLGIDPLVTASQIILGMQTIVSRNINPLEEAVISCTEIYTDGVHNAIPSNVEILGDTRSFSPSIQNQIETRMREMVEGICKANGAKCEFTYTNEFAPTINSRECVNYVYEAAKVIIGEEKIDTDCQPWMASEDFSRYLMKVPGCFFFLGSGKYSNLGENIPLHNSEYDYNDDVLLVGAEIFAELIKLRLS